MRKILISVLVGLMVIGSCFFVVNGFTKINAETYYVHYLPKNIIATFKAGGQYTPNDVPFVEQYQIGGMSSVRGYSESLLLGANSYYASLEMLFPIPFLPMARFPAPTIPPRWRFTGSPCSGRS